MIIVISVGLCSQTVNAAEQNKVYTADHIKDVEARQLYQRVLDATEFLLEDTPEAETALYSYNGEIGRMLIGENYYAIYDITEEEYNAIPAYELFLESSLFVKIQYRYLHDNNTNLIFGSEEKLVRYLLNEITLPSVLREAYENGTNKEPMEAMIEIYKYQYRYLQSHGCFYNFVKGADYLELQGNVNQDVESKKPSETISLDEVLDAVDREYNNETSEKNSESLENDTEKKERSLEPNNIFVDVIKNHIVSIIIIAILVVLLAYITIKNKRTNKKDID